MSRLIFISGPMGSGKSTVAPAVAARLGVPAFDLDRQVVTQTGLSVAEIFRTRGEAGFRELERAAVLRLVREHKDGVIALGGGTVANAQTRELLLSRGVVVTLTASVKELARRVAGAVDRPLLSASDPVATLSALLDERRAAYAECHGSVGTEQPVEAIVEDVVRVIEEAPVVVPLGERTYRVEIGRGFRDRLGARVEKAARGSAVLATDLEVAKHWLAEARASIEARGRAVVEAQLPPGEQHKVVSTLERIWDAALDAAVDRNGIVVALGGGVVGDLAGFAASTLLRGVAFGQVPTTLLAMVDSSVGGKTGIDRPQGKNLVGTFYQPRFVLCDVDFLSTLPRAERVAGLAEVVKSAWLDGEESVARLEQDAEALVSGDADATIRAVRMAVQLKARIVTADERESGPRMLLNLGHTVGHAIEAAHGFGGLRHGEAVSLGMVAAFRIARHLGRGATTDGERLGALLRRLGLPTDLESALDSTTFDYLVSDKKRRADHIRFVVPSAPGETELVDVAIDTIREALR